jgi:tetratricopeptide (TPR) repeat protein
MHRLLGDLDRDEADALAAVAMMRRFRPPDSAFIAMTLKEVAQVANLRGNHARCEAVAREAIDGWPARLGRTHVYFAALMQLHASCAHALGRIDEAEAELRAALDVFARTRGEHSLSTARARLQLGRLYNQRRAGDEAEPLLRQALADFSAALGDRHVDVGATLAELADARCVQGAHADAHAQFDRALQILTALPQALASAQVRMAQCVVERDPPRARELIDAALAWFDANAIGHPHRKLAVELRAALGNR